MRGLLASLAACCVVLVIACCLALAAAPLRHATENLWFAPSVGNATQVVSVVGVGGSSAKMGVWQRSAAGWQPVGVGIPAHIGSAVFAPQAYDKIPRLPRASTRSTT